MQEKLTNQERLFALEYLTDNTMNAEKAALKAGYSASVARKKAYSWVGKSGQNSKPHVAEFIERRMKKLEKNYDTEIEALTTKLKQILEINFLDIVEEMNWDISIEGLKKLSPQKRLLITNVIATKDGIRLVVLNTDKAFEMLAKRLAMWKEDNPENWLTVSINTNGLEKYI